MSLDKRIEKNIKKTVKPDKNSKNFRVIEDSFGTKIVGKVSGSGGLSIPVVKTLPTDQPERFHLVFWTSDGGTGDDQLWFKSKNGHWVPLCYFTDKVPQ